MTRKRKRLVTLIGIMLSLLLAVSLPFVSYAGEGDDTDPQVPASSGGVTGTVNWAFYEEEGRLVLSGEGGATEDFSSSGMPWYEYLSDITSLVVEEGVTVLGTRTVYGAKNLVDVSLPSTLVEIHEGAFRGCTSLKTITIPDSVEVLERAQFYNCTALEEVVLGGSYTALPEILFGGCSNLQRVTIPKSVVSVAGANKASFDGCAALAEVIYGGTRDAWKALLAADTSNNLAAAATTCSDGTYDDQDNTPSSDLIGGTTGEVNWSFDVDTGTLTLSGNGATADYTSATTASKSAPWLEYMKDIVTLDVQEGVTGLGDRLFYGASSLTNVSLPESLTSIGEGTFRECASLVSVEIPENVTTLKRVAFYNCSNLEEVTIKANITVLTDKLFQGNSSLRSVTIPGTVTEVMESAFKSCDALSEITFGGTVEEWEAVLTTDTGGMLKKDTITVTCTNGVYVYGQGGGEDDPYSGMTGEVTWTFDPDTGTLTISGEGVTGSYTSGTIADNAAPWFKYMDDIVSVIVEDGVTVLGKKLFYGADNLVSVSLPDSLTEILEGVFRQCPSLQSIVIPDSVEVLGRAQFYQCTSLETAVLGGNYEYLDEIIFSGCSSLKEVSIPGTVVTLNKNVFANCKALIHVIYGNTIENWMKLLDSSTYASPLCTDAITVTCTDGTYVYGQNELGNGLSYTLSNGVLMISGTGEMGDFTDASSVPWAGDAASVQTIVIKNGVSRIGANALGGCANLREVIYIGSEEQWEAVKGNSGSGNDPMLAADLTLGTSGDCGENVSWTFDPDTGTLTISGTGAMTDYSGGGQAPWKYITNDIVSLVINDGVTTTGDYAFYALFNLKDISLPGTLEWIGDYTFGSCISLETVTLPEGVRIIGSKAFSACASLDQLYLPESLTHIDMKAFNYIAQISDVYYNGTKLQWDRIILSESAQGNSSLLSSNIHYLGTDIVASEVYTDVSETDWYYESLQYLVDNELINTEPDSFSAEEAADMDMILEALYRRAGEPGMYADARDWAVGTRLVDTRVNGTVSAAGLAAVLYKAGVNNGQAEEGQSAVEWCAERQYFAAAGIGQNQVTEEKILSRGEACTVLAAYLGSAEGTADRYWEQVNILKTALAENGDGNMYIFTPDLTFEERSSKPGDCTLIVFPNGKTMMIDFGVKACQDIVLQMLKDLEITSLDYVALTHPHSDHVGNGLAAAEYIYANGGSIGTYFYSGYGAVASEQNLTEYLREKGVNILNSTTAGDVLEEGDVRVEFFNPSQALVDATGSGTEAVNNVSLVMKFTYGNSTYLTGGDLYCSQEEALVREYGDMLLADVTKTNHHGAYTSNGSTWINAVNPLIMITDSDDIGNAIMAETVTKNGVAYFSAGIDGNVLVIMDNSANYFVLHQYDTVLRRDYDGDINLQTVILSQPEIEIEEVADKTMGDPDFTLAVTGGAEELNYQYSSSDEAVLTVDENGIVHLTGPGTAVITVSKTEKGYETVSQTITITVLKSEETAPDETVPDETTPEETVPDETAPDETAPDETTPDDTTSETAMPDTATPDATIPDTATDSASSSTRTEGTAEAADAQQPGNVATGDSTSSVVWILPLIISLAVAVLVIKRYYRNFQ